MSRQAETSVFAGRLDAAALEARGYKRCEHCEGLLPLNVSRCRRRQCSGYAATWARDTMRKTRENLRAYGGLACMCTLTAPGQEAGGAVMSQSAEAAKAFNRQIRQTAATLAGQAGSGHDYARFVCECGCNQTVELLVTEYDRQGGAWLKGHKPA